MNISRLSRSLGLCASIAAIATSQSAFAQETDDGAAQEAESGLNTILVTATKATEDSQDVPISLSVLDTDTLTQLRGDGGDTLFLSGRVPSLNIETSFGRIFPRPGIRGLNNTDFDFNASQPVSYIMTKLFGKTRCSKASRCSTLLASKCCAVRKELSLGAIRQPES